MKPTKEQYEQAVKIAADRGKEDGENAASWWEQDAIGGRVVHQRDAIATARRVLQGLEDVDPEIVVALPSADLSGQWAGSITGPGLVVDCWAEVGIEGEDYEALAVDDADAEEEICDAYSAAFDEAARDAVETACKELLKEEEFVHLLLLPGGEIACGDGPGMLVPQTDINRVTCPDCIEFHENEEDLEDDGTERALRCPSCGAPRVVRDVATWDATSIIDPTNRGFIEECMCGDCGLSFWVSETLERSNP